MAKTPKTITVKVDLSAAVEKALQSIMARLDAVEERLDSEQGVVDGKLTLRGAYHLIESINDRLTPPDVMSEAQGEGDYQECLREDCVRRHDEREHGTLEENQPLRKASRVGRITRDDESEVLDTPACTSVANLKGGHISCTVPTDAKGRHDGWAHGNAEFGLIWTNECSERSRADTRADTIDTLVSAARSNF